MPPLGRLALATHEGHELDREAKAHMALAVLLRKNRAPEKREEVRRILESNLSTAKIVEAIKRLDSETDEEPEREGSDSRAVEATIPSEELTRREATKEEPRRPGRAPNPFRWSLPKLKSILKLPRVRTPFFRYLFREFPRIADFGRLTHVFSPVFLLPVLRLETGVPKFFSESLTGWANELLAFLAPVLVVGWRHLSKKHYNMIVALDRLCREITSTNLRLLNLRDRSLIDKLRSLETLFLAFHYRVENAEEVIEALGNSMTRDSELSRKSDRARLLAGRILQPDLTIPSLYNFLLGLNMMKFRTALTLTELLTNDLGELFETESYACDPDVEAKIQALIEELKTKIAKLHREWSRLKRYKDLVTTGEPGTGDFPEMTSVYEFTSSTLKPRSFAEDRENIMDFAPNFFRRFESCCSPILNGVVELKGKGKAEIFASRAFENELDRLRLTASKLERAAFGFRSFPYSRYISIKKEGKGGVSTELEVIAHLQEAASAFVGIGTKLERVLGSTRETPRAESSETAVKAQKALPLDPNTLRADRPAVLPHSDALIAAGSWLGGKTVKNAVSAVASVCLQSAVHLHERSFVEALALEGPMHERIQNHLATVRRVADETDYDQLVGILLRDSTRQ